MTIIIETPQPPVRERLVRVPADCIDDTSGPHEVHTDRVYNATPADLERAGWVEEHLLVTARAEMRELGSERDEVRLILDASAGETTADAATRLHNDWVDARERADRVERERAVDAISGRAKLAAAERERDEARAERDKLDAKLAQAEERGDLADQRAIDAIAERDEVRRQRDAEIASRDALARVLEQVERERDEARCLYEAAHCERMRITDVLQRVERERDEARAALATMTRQRDDALQVLGQAREALPSDMRGGWLVDAVRRLVRERDEARAALAAMTRQHDDATALASRLRCDLDRATDREDGVAAERARIVAIVREDARRLRLSWPTIADAMLALADRLERGVHAGTPAPASLPRATDEELFAAYQTAYIVSCGVKDPSEDQRSITRVMPAERKGIAAVAARVRREQCLVTRAVEAGVKVTITRTSERMPGCCVGLWDVRVTRRPDAPGEYYSHGVPAADVPKTLARLLGEVTRGQ